MVAVRAQRAFTRAKEAGRACEDFILGCRVHGRYAVSDGASVSYDSRGWARTLCRQFLADANPPGAGWLWAARDRFAAAATAPADDWAAAHAAERGSFATFLGIAITGPQIVVHAIGDTALFVITADGGLAMLPDLAPEAFRHDPALLCSRPGRSAFDDSDAAFAAAVFTLPVPAAGWAGTRLLAMTDALAEWVAGAADAAERRRRLEEMATPQDGAAFDLWAGEAIASGQVRRDDCALLTLRL